ncbi:MAG TPA: ATP-dependent DNA ligase [Microbacterium sp.]|uniref:ATP-dependent DNA ligase n=1 Tax=Microbacterium sp. TaxID=51671 RepID=UPI002B46AEA3|nr:ATP-dependent DNA ligase [Microbacterium sp.]HKT57363.1 ATP-dependent DNA ligase [Microbacterium sp.]
MLLDDVVTTSAAVAATRSRRAKVDALAELLPRLQPEEVVVAVGLLTASPRQGRLGVGWRGAFAIDASHADAPALAIADVDDAFEQLAAASGPGSAAERTVLLRDLAERATATEWDFVVRVILGELRTGALEGVLTEAIARAGDRPIDVVRRAAMLSGDLGETARIALAEPPGALEAVSLEVGRPVQPMLAATAPTVAEAMAAAGESSVEFKLDGARIQVHRRGDRVQVFTRNLADITHRVPELVEIVRGLDAESVILDGETLALDADGRPRAFQDTMARFGADADRAVALRPWFFDILHVDGRDLIDAPLRERRAELQRVVGECVIPGILTADAEEAESLSRDALAAGHEGVVVKAIDAPYAAGRRGSAWIKVKPVATFDLVVLAVEWGSGRRTGLLSNLHLGALDPVGEFGEPGGFVMVGKTFKGLTDALLRWQTDTFPSYETRRSAHAVHLRPEVVVEIALDGVQRSSRYPGGIALRFARVKRYRPDKTAAQADTIQALRGLLHAADGA